MMWFYVFLALWAVAAIAFRMNKQSVVITIGGGFLVGLLLFMVGYFINSLITPDEIKSKAIKPQGNAEAIQHIRNNWGKLTNYCPGINKYQKDLTFKRVEFTGLDQWATAVLRVNDNPDRELRRYRAAGHNCFFAISPDGRELTISKSMCVALCLDKEVPYSSGADYVTKF
ncbi:MAG: hypothetical protein AB1Y26_07645 [Cycloclasticus sp.]